MAKCKPAVVAVLVTLLKAMLVAAAAKFVNASTYKNRTERALNKGDAN
jgi:hypothetical protein